MLYYDIDPRDGGTNNAASCSACCCQSIRLRPGETNMLTLNYAPWSVPLSPPGITPGMSYSIETNCDSCPDEVVSNSNYYFTALASVATFSLATDAASTVSTIFAYDVVPLTGPAHGKIEFDAANPGVFDYTPHAGYTGYDYFSYTTTDDQGNEITRHVQIAVGGATGVGDLERMSLVPYIFSSKVVTDQNSQTVQLPIFMPVNARDCQMFRLTVKQPARNCDCMTFHHIACFDIRTTC